MRQRQAFGEKPLDWVGSSKHDFLAFPSPVQREIGNALGLAQFGGKHPNAKLWKGEGPGVFEAIAVGRGRDLGGEVEILSGLAPGAEVVVDGAFLLKAEFDKARGEGGHDPGH